MKLASFKRLLSTDFQKEYKKLIDQLSLSINNAMDSIFLALSNNITIRDNIKCTVRDIIVTVDSSGFPTQSAAFTLDNNNSKVEGVQIILALNQTNTSIYPTSQPFISGVQGTGNYTINNITGLQANNKYLLRLIAYQN